MTGWVGVAVSWTGLNQTGPANTTGWKEVAAEVSVTDAVEELAWTGGTLRLSESDCADAQTAAGEEDVGKDGGELKESSWDSDERKLRKVPSNPPVLHSLSAEEGPGSCPKMLGPEICCGDGCFPSAVYQDAKRRT